MQNSHSGFCQQDFLSHEPDCSHDWLVMFRKKQNYKTGLPPVGLCLLLLSKIFVPYEHDPNFTNSKGYSNQQQHSSSIYSSKKLFDTKEALQINCICRFKLEKDLLNSSISPAVKGELDSKIFQFRLYRFAEAHAVHINVCENESNLYHSKVHIKCRVYLNKHL